MQLGLTAQQLEERRSGLYGTDAKMIVEGHWNELWRIKKGLAQGEDLSNVLRVQLGSFTEPFNCFWFEKQTGREVMHRNVRWSAVENNKAMPEWMAANIDGTTRTSKGQPAYIDFKHVGVAGDAVVERYTPQLTHCALVCGVEHWIISFLIGNSKWECVEQEVDVFFADELLALEAEFWSYVENNIEPEDRIKAAVPRPEPVYRKVSLADADKDFWPNWGADMIDEFGKLANTWDSWTACNIARDEIKRLLPEDVGEVTRGNIAVKRTKAGSVTINLKHAK
jgi:hypothetical protein